MTVESERACDMLSTALEMEEKGRDFYEKSAKSCSSPQVKQVFEMLAKDETIHIERINQIFDELSSGETWCSDWEEKTAGPDLGQAFHAMAIEKGKEVSCRTEDVEALDMGIEFEMASIKFYKEHLDKAIDEIEKAFLKKMIAEEKSHHAALNDVKFYLTDPDGWFREKEGGRLDGA